MNASILVQRHFNDILILIVLLTYWLIWRGK